MSETKKIFQYDASFELESGKVLPRLHLAYTTHGSLNAERNNTVWVFHALTANSEPLEWWHGLVGEGNIFDPSKYFIVCVNMPGSCYGSISPLDINEATGKPFYRDFPWFTTRDMIRAYQHLKEHLGIEKIYVGLGGSMGGQQLLEWAVEEPSAFEHIIPIATNARHSPWGIAFNASQRWCIESDPTWKDEDPASGIEGMKIARSMALLSYRNYHTYDHAQQSHTSDTGHLPVDQQLFRSESYQRYQGEKLAKRFNAYSYYFLSKAMDAHNIARGRADAEEVLQSITARTLVISVESDILFPVQEQQFIAEHIPGAEWAVISSQYGHDGFLLEFEKIAAEIEAFLTPPMEPPAYAQYLFLSSRDKKGSPKP
ncbi:homoserine O-acetyltransferase [Segetibacter sp. 3557_3]|uniref:homoserine O-acetyltransferase family protein n=1 Tax=Segetibacter sp. 3557_3 TaxID=2547429 RepID=UPI001058A396|nr:homoserine O-acetyltransferase [Segetibacter sp. 3557_3]TDH26171.1 homoserine O-acetyltransferase [Segetibacter sp. 3557_3]